LSFVNHAINEDAVRFTRRYYCEIVLRSERQASRASTWTSYYVRHAAYVSSRLASLSRALRWLSHMTCVNTCTMVSKHEAHHYPGLQQCFRKHACGYAGVESTAFVLHACVQHRYVCACTYNRKGRFPNRPPSSIMSNTLRWQFYVCMYIYIGQTGRDTPGRQAGRQTSRIIV
jgi:hypothetical protein